MIVIIIRLLPYAKNKHASTNVQGFVILRPSLLILTANIIFIITLIVQLIL